MTPPVCNCTKPRPLNSRGSCSIWSGIADRSFRPAGAAAPPAVPARAGRGDAAAGRAFLDLEVLRRTASGQGLTPLQDWLRANPAKPGAAQAHAVLDRVAAATRALRETAERAKDDPHWTAFDWLLATMECVEALTQSPDEAVGSVAWAQTGSEAMVAFVNEWAQALTERGLSAARAEGASAAEGPLAERPLPLPTFSALLDRAVQGVTLRSPFLGHPRVLILGGIEARSDQRRPHHPRRPERRHVARRNPARSVDVPAHATRVRPALGRKAHRPVGPRFLSGLWPGRGDPDPGRARRWGRDGSLALHQALARLPQNYQVHGGARPAGAVL